MPATDHFIYRYLLENKPFAFFAEYDSELRLRSMTEEIGQTVLIQAD
ncbi:MAG: hypothetical protein OHK0039_21680 [Bacteroidia bacterium]